MRMRSQFPLCRCAKDLRFASSANEKETVIENGRNGRGIDYVLDDMIKEFCGITNVAADDARKILLENNFSLQDAIKNFFETRGAEKVVSMENTSEQSEAASSSQSSSKFTLLNWNIDGLNEEHLTLRTLAIAEQINSLQPHAVYLQEVVEFALRIFIRQCRGYTISSFMRAPYFCAILIRRMPTLQIISRDNTAYKESNMGRSLMQINVVYDGKPISLLTTHLESTRDSREERIRQLQICLQRMNSIGSDSAVILAGDLNLRDDELQEIGGLTDGIKDAWIETGSDINTKFSWDTSLNDNLNIQGKRKPKFRFDRVFYRPPRNGVVLPKRFKFVGRNRLETCDMFASDHWGIVCEFAFFDG